MNIGAMSFFKYWKIFGFIFIALQMFPNCEQFKYQLKR